MISGLKGSDVSGGIAETDPKVALSMGSKMYGFPYDNQRFLGSRDLTFQAESQKLTLKLPSVWGAKCMDFHMKINDFWAQGI